MAWSDEPTDAQLAVVYRFIRWEMSTPEAREAAKWLGVNSTRREVSFEIKRLRDLYNGRKLNRDLVFGSEIWDGCPIAPRKEK